MLTNSANNPGFESKRQAPWFDVEDCANEFIGFLSEKNLRLSVILDSSSDSNEEAFHSSLHAEHHPLRISR
jgi:hypothetical protein